LHKARAANRVLNVSAMAGRWNQVARRGPAAKRGGHVWRIAEIRIESHVVVGRVEYRVIEDVEKLSVEAKSESLGELRVF
jgi:hypothetical protein